MLVPSIKFARAVCLLKQISMNVDVVTVKKRKAIVLQENTPTKLLRDSLKIINKKQPE